jgi:uncharacterized protein
MPDAIEISRRDETTHGNYRAEVPGSSRAAELTWVAQGPIRIANHTFVPPEARGRGIAQALVEALVADARQHGFTVDPQCSYVAALFRRNPDWADVRAL